MERKNDHQLFGIERLQRLPLTGRMDGSVQYFYLCGLLCILASIMLLLKKSHLILWLFYAKLVCCLWLFPSIPQLEVCFSVSLWCFLCLPCLPATYVVPFYTWRPSKVFERKWEKLHFQWAWLVHVWNQIENKYVKIASDEVLTSSKSRMCVFKTIHRTLFPAAMRSKQIYLSQIRQSSLSAEWQ